MAVNRVDYGDETLIDISDSTVNANNLMNGEVAYGSDGVRIVGRATGGSNLDLSIVNGELNQTYGDTDVETRTPVILDDTLSATNSKLDAIISAVQNREPYVLSDEDRQEIGQIAGGVNPCLMKFYVDNDGYLYMVTQGQPYGTWFVDNDGYLCVTY